jgi:hypothetical protein
VIVPTLAAIMLAVVGHPFPASCNAAMPPFGEYGLTYWDAAGRPDHVVLSAPCGELGRPLDPSDPMQATAIIVAIHEATHVVLASRDETLVECHALRLFRPLVDGLLVGELGGDALARYLGNRFTGELYGNALRFDRALPPVYHESACT